MTFKNTTHIQIPAARYTDYTDARQGQFEWNNFLLNQDISMYSIFLKKNASMFVFSKWSPPFTHILKHSHYC